MTVDKATEALVRADQTALEQMVEQIRKVPGSDVEFHNEAIAYAKGQHARLEGLRTSVTRPLNAALKAVNDLFRPALSAASTLEAASKKQLTDYRSRQLEEQRKALEAAREAAKANQPAQAVQIMASAPPPQAPSAGLSYQDFWAWEVADPAAVPREWLCVDAERLNKAAKEAAKGPPPVIPGIKFTKQSRAVYRGAK